MRGVDNLQTTSYQPLGNYMQYNPIDESFLLNSINAQAGANNRAVVNQAGLNRGQAIAGLLTSGYNYQTATGNALMEMNKLNNENRQKVAEFNRGTDQANSQGLMQAQQANMSNNQLIAQATQQAAELRQAERQQTDANKSANLSGLYNSLGQLGREQFAMDMISNNKALLYDWIGRQQNNLSSIATPKMPNSNSQSFGGYLTIKNKKKK